MIKTTSNNNNNENILKFKKSLNKIKKMETSIQKLTATTTTPISTKKIKAESTPQNLATELTKESTIKNERRLSSASESSVEPMDLGRTPTPPPPPPPHFNTQSSYKKILKNKSQIDNEQDDNNCKKTKSINNDLQTTPIRRSRSYSEHDSDVGQYDSELEQDEEHEQNNNKPNKFDTKKLRNNNLNNNSHNRYNHHYRHNRTVVAIDSNDNPNSLRKKFRISTTNLNNNNNNMINNNNYNVSLDNKNNYQTNSIDDERNNIETDDSLKVKSNSIEIFNKINKTKNSKDNLPITPTSSNASSRRASDDNDDHLSNASNEPSVPIDHQNTIEDEENINRTSQNESGFVDGSSHNLINSINSLSSPDSGGSGNGLLLATNVPVGSTITGNNNDDVKRTYVCPICEVVSATPHEFTNHIRSHNYSSGDTENFTCRICSKVLSSASSLDRHVLVHTGERPFNCKYCHLTFTTNGNMHRHMRTHKQHPHQKRRSSNNNNNNNVQKNNPKDNNNLNTKTINCNNIMNNINNNNNKNNNNVNTNLINNINNLNLTTLNANTNNNINNTNINNNNTNSTSLISSTANATITQNGNHLIGDGGVGGESYESEDGGCSTDSSASNNSSNCKSNNVRNNNNNNNGINTDIHNQNAITTTINNNNIKFNNYKRKSTDEDFNEIIKRRMKTINNNDIISEIDSVNDFTTSTILSKSLNKDNSEQPKVQNSTELHQHKQTFCCPVCNRNDFMNMLSLGVHMDNSHSDIPAKCRQCDVVFKTHNQLNVHRCCLTKQLPPLQQSPNLLNNIGQSFKDFTFVDFKKFALIPKPLCEQNIRQSIVNPKFECTKCYLAFPCANTLEIHIQECNVVEKKLKPVPHLIDPQALILSNMLMQHPTAMAELPKDFSIRNIINIQQLMQQQQQKLFEEAKKLEEFLPEQRKKTADENNKLDEFSTSQLKRSLSNESITCVKEENVINNNSNNKRIDNINENDDRDRDEFFAHLDLKNKSMMSFNNRISQINENDNIVKHPSEYKSLELNRTSSPINELNSSDSGMSKQLENDHRIEKRDQKLQQQLQQNDSRDLADVQSILNNTASSSNFLRNFEVNVNTPMSSECGYGKDEEEAQDSFTAEFRKMKLRGEFPCKLCTAVFPNLRALKGHNRIHISSAGNAGPFRCNMCLYSINDKAALVRHMRTHNGDRPYECAVCNYAFTTKANCERHLRNRHSKTTRDDVKRAIIYHPSEDSSCDDPTKKLHLFSSSEFDNDDELQINPKDRSTPVSHLKEILQSETIVKPSVKIQVKSLEKLLDKPNSTNIPIESTQTNNFHSNLTRYEIENHHHQTSSNIIDKQNDHHDDSIDSVHQESGHAIDLSMDVLDLSKKTKPVVPEENSNMASKQIPDALKLDLSQQWLLTQQQILSEALPKMDQANYIQFCRNLALPMTFNPFLTAFNPLLTNCIADFNKFSPFMNSATLFGNSTIPGMPGINLPSIPSTNTPNNNGQNQLISQEISQDVNNIQSINSSMNNNAVNTSTASTVQHLPKNLNSPIPPDISNQLNLSGNQSSIQSQRLSAHQQIQNNNNLNQSINNNGPVKMVIKNGVLMPKQKQRRYRTERPFACEHCSARFTLRSNMERHIKQQHPQFWAQRQRSGQHVIRGRGSSSNVMSQMQSSHLRNQTSNSLSSNHFGTISDQVKYALLAQQLKVRKDTDILQQALTQGSNGTPYNSINNSNNVNNGNLEDDDNDPKLVIDEDEETEEMEDQDEAEDDYDDNDNYNPEEQQKLDKDNEVNYKKFFDHHNEKKHTNLDESAEMNNILGAKKVAKTILEQAIKAGSSSVNNNSLNSKEENLKITNTPGRVETVGKFLKDIATSSFKTEESNDLVSVSKLVDNATNNAMAFNNYFKSNDANDSTNNVNHMEQSDEEGLVASGSASDNNSGPEESTNNTNSAQQKKKSAYSLAPNRVPCPYCDRIFPWSSSLRRHILTHTGQKPFKCSHCPLLFTTKSNCDRHLLRKHGNIESAVSLYVPIDDMPEPVPMPKAIAEAIQAAKAAAVASVAASQNSSLVSQFQGQQSVPIQQQQQQQVRNQKNSIDESHNQEIAKDPLQPNAVQTTNLKHETQSIVQISPTDLPFKCHLCDSSFGERMQCLDHIKINHIQDFALLLAKGAIDTDIDPNCTQIQQSTTEEDDKRDDGRGKYPDYANRKVICAFCVRRFWSTEDLRRHMRTHSGERPFQCEVCLRKFTLKHSMLRHMKKHNGTNHNNQMTTQNSGSDCSDDEQPSANIILANSLRNHKIHELLSKVGNNANEWQNNRISSSRDNDNLKSDDTSEMTNSSMLIASGLNNGTSSDLIGNLLGITDSSLLNKFLANPSEAAKFFGVEK